MRDTTADWEKLARQNAYWAVLTEDEFRQAPTEETLASFFARGEANLDQIAREIAAIYPDFAPRFDAVIDFGCGAGRLLVPMARRAERAYGIDVSPTMRGLAASHARAFGLDNVECLATAENLLARGLKADWLNSLIVLQHIEPRRGYFIINDLLQCVRPGGFVSLHVPLFKTIDRRDYFSDRVMYFRNDYYATETVFIDRDTYGHPDIQMYDYEASTVMALFHKNGMNRVHVLHDGATTGIHGYIFVAKRAS